MTQMLLKVNIQYIYVSKLTMQ